MKVPIGVYSLINGVARTNFGKHEKQNRISIVDS